MKEKIKLGDEVRCIHTGYTGIAMARIEFINGCIQYDVARKITKDGELPEPKGIDQGSLEIVKPKIKKKVKRKRTGGANNPARSMRGF